MVYIWNMHNDCSMFSPTDSIPIIGASSRRGIFDCEMGKRRGEVEERLTMSDMTN